MYTEEDLGKLGLTVGKDSEENDKEKSLKWLLDMDLSEPEEDLFTVADNEYQDTGLSNYEVEVAARPLERGNARSDDLDAYVDEEIIISSDDTVASIYTDEATDVDESSRADSANGVMAIDYSADTQGLDNTQVRDMHEGRDILGLADNDDMVSGVMGGVQIAFEGRQCAVDQWHAAVGLGPRDAFEGGF